MTTTTASKTAVATTDADLPLSITHPLPDTARAQLNGELDGQTVVAWAECDLDDHNRYAQRHAILTDQALLLLDGEGLPVRRVPIDGITEVSVVEGLGVDRLQIIRGEGVAAEVRYSRKARRGVNKLQRKLERRISTKPDAERPPEWLEAVEREAEKRDICQKCGQLIPAYAEGVCPECLQKRRILWRLLGIAKPYRKYTTAALAATIALSLVSAIPPVFTRHMIDDGLTARNVNALMFWSGLLLVATVIAELFGAIRMRLLANVGTWVAADLRHMVYAHLQELGLRYFSKRRTGSLITRVTNDTDRLWDFIVFGSVDIFRNVLMILVIAGVMAWMNWRLAIIALLPLPVLTVLTYLRGLKMQKLFGRMWSYWSRMGAVVGDALPGVRVVKAFANEQREIDRFDQRSNEYTEKELELHRVWTTLGPIVSLNMRLGGILVWLAGGYMVITHPENPNNTVGTLIAFSAFLWQFYGPIMELANSNRMVTRAATSAQRVFEVLDTPPDIFSKSDAITPDTFDGRIEFKQVSFSYEGMEPALREVSLVIEPGQMIGLCGPSGAGKSTFVNLICRFYDVTDGQILVDGVDIRDYDVKWLRRHVGIVLQEPYLFHGTVADNIRYGKPEAPAGEVIAAAKAANAHDFIVGFPDGYDTMVGERGQSLSGGERQRISIARAILHNPKILILDEATSSVDTETERQIQQALDRLVAGRTTIAIAHRLSTLQAADLLVVLEKGKIAEQGLHRELVDKPDGIYAKLHKTQLEMSAQVAIR